MLETMIKKKEAEDLKERLGFQNAFVVASVWSCVYWREGVKLTLVSSSQNHICGDDGEGDTMWHFVGIYGLQIGEDKHKTWVLIRRLCGESLLPILQF